VENTVLKEDNVMDYNKWVQGIASREFSSKKVFLRDLLGKPHEGEQYPNAIHNNNVLPYPLEELVKSIGNIVSNIDTSLKLLITANENPILKSDPHNVKRIQDAEAALKNAAKLITNTVNNLDNLKITIKINR